MKKVLLSALLTFAVLGLPLAASAMPKPVFDNTSTASYQGADKTANVMVSALINGTLQRIHFIAKNKGRANNANLIFTNLSSVKGVEGDITFESDGVWIGFAGSYFQPNINLFQGTVPAWGAIKISGDATFNPVDKTVSGTNGSIVQWEGNVNLRGVLKSGGDRAMMKVKINPTTANLITFTNTTTLTTTSALVRVSLPAIQMTRVPQ